ncbi:hypothetical protein D9M70_552240 [compost metagenome]
MSARSHIHDLSLRASCPHRYRVGTIRYSVGPNRHRAFCCRCRVATNGDTVLFRCMGLASQRDGMLSLGLGPGANCKTPASMFNRGGVTAITR